MQAHGSADVGLAFDFQAAAMEFDVRLDQRQAEAGALDIGVEGAFDPHEGLENFADVLGGDADAGIGDSDQRRAVGAGSRADSNGAARGRELDGIGEQVDEDLPQQAGIASAVEEQGAATQEIARNTQQAATGTQEVTSNITGVTQAAGEAGAAASQVLSSAGQLTEESEVLRKEVDSFVSRIRTA